MSGSEAYPTLAQPVQLGALQAKHRVFMSSLTRNRAIPTTIPNDHMVEYYTQRARSGGAGLIFAEGTLISPQGTEWPNAPGIWDEEHAQAWKKVVDAVHAEGTQIVLQLWHLGRVGHPDMPEQKQAGLPVWGPSAISARGGKFRQLPGEPGYQTPTEIDEKHIQIVLDDYEKAARNAKLAGFDGVELHSANGYLVDQFLSDNSNHRTDQWGGSVENRTRFGLEALKRLIKVYGNDRVGIKVSPCGGYNDISYTSHEVQEETFHHYVKAIDSLKPAYIQIAQYNAFGDGKFDGKPQGWAHDVVETYGKDVVNSNFVTNCGYDADSANKVIEAGKVKAVSFGQKFIANPDLSKRFQEKIPLNEDYNYFGFYNVSNGDPTPGYTDYPFAQTA